MAGSGGGNVSKQLSKQPSKQQGARQHAWYGDVAASDVVSLQTHLSPHVEALRSKAKAACPGRTAELIATCTRGLLGLTAERIDAATLSPAERLVVDLAEQFVLDVHSVTDEQFAALRGHYDTPEILAMLFEMALNDGFNKMEKVSLEGPRG